MFDIVSEFPTGAHKSNWKTLDSFAGARTYLTDQQGSYEQWVFEPVGRNDWEGNPLYRVRSMPHGLYLRAMPRNHPDFGGAVDAISWSLEGTEWTILEAYRIDGDAADGWPDDTVWL